MQSYKGLCLQGFTELPSSGMGGGAAKINKHLIHNSDSKGNKGKKNKQTHTQSSQF